MTMNSQIEASIKAVIDQHTDTIVKALAAKYGFDESEAMAALGAEPGKFYTSKAKKAPAKAPKAVKAAKAPAEEKPKKGANSFLLWSKENRAEVKADNPEMTGREVTKELGRIWKEEVEEDVKAEWKARASGSSSEGEDEDA